MSDRRAFLRGLAALPIVGGTIAATGSDPVFEAIKKHRAAYAAFDAVLSEEENDAQALRVKATSTAEDEARWDMHEVGPTTFAGLRAYVTYWESHICRSQFLGETLAWEAIPTIADAVRMLIMEGVDV